MSITRLPAGIGLATLPSLRATLAKWKAADAEPEPEPERARLRPVELFPPAPVCSVPIPEAVAA